MNTQDANYSLTFIVRFEQQQTLIHTIKNWFRFWFEFKWSKKTIEIVWLCLLTQSFSSRFRQLVLCLRQITNNYRGTSNNRHHRMVARNVYWNSFTTRTVYNCISFTRGSFDGSQGLLIENDFPRSTALLDLSQSLIYFKLHFNLRLCVFNLPSLLSTLFVGILC